MNDAHATVLGPGADFALWAARILAPVAAVLGAAFFFSDGRYLTALFLGASPLVYSAVFGLAQIRRRRRGPPTLQASARFSLRFALAAFGGLVAMLPVLVATALTNYFAALTIYAISPEAFESEIFSLICRFIGYGVMLVPTLAVGGWVFGGVLARRDGHDTDTRLGELVRWRRANELGASAGAATAGLLLLVALFQDGLSDLALIGWACGLLLAALPHLILTWRAARKA